LADAAAALVFGFSFFGFLASRFPFGMAAAPSSGLSVAPIGEITSHPPKVIASDHLTNRDATEIPARAEAEGISKKSLWTAKKALPVPLPPPLGQ